MRDRHSLVRSAARALGATLLAAALLTAAAARAQFPITESFTNKTAPGWTLLGNASLTAQSGIDAAGAGWLRLTAANTDEAGSAIYNTAFPSSSGIAITFDYADYGGTGADGFSFYLFDGATSAPTVGSSGGPLGYAAKYSNATCATGPLTVTNPGVTSGYVGIGFDEYGNFSACESGVASPGRTPQSVVIRGSGTRVAAGGTQTAFRYLKGVTVASVQPAATVDGVARAAPRHARVSILNQRITVAMDFGAGFVTLINGYDLSSATGQVALPATFKMGLSGSTGGNTNVHEIRNVLVSLPANLTLGQTVTPGTVSVTGTVTFTITITNDNTNAALGSALADAFPAGLTGISWTAATAGGATVGRASGTGNLAETVNLPKGGSVTYTVTATVGAAAAGTVLANTVTLTPPVGVANLLSNTVAASLTVNQMGSSTTLASSANPSVSGQPVTFTATTAAVAPGSGTPTGTVTFLDGASSIGSCTLAGGSCTLSTPGLAVATHAVTAAYGGSTAFAASTSAAVSQRVDRAATSTAILPSLSSFSYGTPVLLTATVAVTGPGAGTPTGAVGFVADGAPVAGCTAVPVTGGATATCSTNLLPVGTLQVGAAYLGDASLLPSATGVAPVSVSRATPTVVATASPNPATFGGAVTLTATLGGAGLTPGGVVTFVEGGTTRCAATASGGGIASCSATGLGGGSHLIAAQYGGDASYVAASGPLALTVQQAPVSVALGSSANPSSYAASVTFTATVSGAGGTPVGSVTFRDATTVLCGGPRPLAAGAATCSVSSLTAGAHAITATYAGSADHLPGTSAPLTQVVGEATPTVALLASPSPSVFGQEVTLSVAASGGGLVPAGTVTVSEGAAVVCGPLALVAGGASCRTSALAVGSHPLVASFDGSGDPNYQGGTSAMVTQVVGRALSDVSLDVSPATAVFGEAVVFTATVTVPAPGAGSPSGIVDFYDGATLLGSATVDPVSGVATFTLPATSPLAVGGHALSAAYAGDGDFQGALSPAIPAFPVGPASTLVTITPSAASPVSGQPVTFTLAVSAVAPGGGVPDGSLSISVDGAAPFVLALAGGSASFASSTLAAGAHAIVASYSGSGSFLTSSGALSQPVAQAATTVSLASTPNPSTHGAAVTLTAALAVAAPGDGAPTGTITFTDGGVTLCGGPRPVAGGTAACTVSSLPAGAHAVTATYGGDADFLGAASAPLTQVVGQAAADVALASSGSPSAYGASVTFTATLSGPGLTPTGLVTFTDGGATLCGGPVVAVAGVATCPTAVLLRGSHTITASYGGDANYTGGLAARSQVVTLADPVLALLPAPSPSVFGQDVALTVSVSGAGAAPTGTVTLTDGASPLCGGPLPLVGGTASCHTAGLSTGAHLLVAAYSGDANYAAGNPATAGHVVDRALTAVALDVSPASAVFGEPMALTATLSVPAPGAGSPSGTVDFYDGATVLGSGTVDPVTGVATFNLPPASPLAVGSHDLSATYAGDLDFQGSISPVTAAFSVGPASSLVTVTPSSAPSVSGETVTFSIAVSAVAPGAGTPSGSLSVALDGGAPFDLVLSGGTASFPTALLSVGSHTVDVAYPGDPSFLSSAGSLSHVVGQASTSVTAAASPEPSVFAQPMTFTVTVSAAGPGSGTPGGTVTLLDGATPLASGPLDASGRAVLAVAFLPAGDHALTVTYPGDADFLPGSGTVAHLVLRAYTDVALTVSDPAPLYGAPVTFSAVVTPPFLGAGAPTGSLAFMDGPTLVGTAALDAAGRASLTTTGLPPGPHAILAAYPGDAGFLDGASAPALLSVESAPVALTLVSSPNPSASGELATWTVQAVAGAPSVAIPDGPVDVYDGAALLASLTLDAAGRASGGSAALAVGTHLLSARSPGDARFAAATSATQAQQVVKAQVSVALSASPSPSLYGAPVAFTARLSVQTPGGGQPTGTVTFSDGTQPLGSAAVDASGDAVFTADGLAVGGHVVTAAFGGDDRFEPRASAPFLQAVSAAGTATSATAAPSPSVYGQPVTLSATVTSAGGVPTGQVDFLDGGVTLLGSGALDASGQATLTTSSLTVGSHPVVARYAGAPEYLGSSAAPVAAVVQPAATTTALAAAPTAPVAGQPVALTATVAAVAPGAGVPGGLVTFSDGATVLGTAGVDPVTGQATLTAAALAVGDHALGAAYAGDGRFSASAAAAPLPLAVGQAGVTVTVTTTPSSSVAGEPVTIAVSVIAASPGAGTPTGQVTLADGATSLGAVTLASGAGQLTTPLPVGAGTISASYAGDAAFLPGSATRLHAVSRASTATVLASSGSPSTFGQAVTLTATVRPVAPGAGRPGGPVTFQDGGTVLGSSPLGADGTASLSTAALAPGLRALSAQYAGDDAFAGSGGAASQDVLRSATTVTLVADPSPASYGEPVAVTVRVTTPGGAVPTGTVAVLDGGVPAGSAALDASGVAVFTLTGLAVGQHPLTASYAGGTGFSPGSASAALTVTQATTTLALASSRNPSRAGRPVTFTATASSDHAAPAGTVTFLDGGAALGTAALSGGVARLTVRTLAKGTHAITAQLAASAGFGDAAAGMDAPQVIENSPPVAGSGTALLLGPGHALRATAAAAGALDGPTGTVELWVRATWTAPEQVGPAPSLVSLGDATGARWAIGVTPDRAGLTVTLGDTTTTVPAGLADGAWHQVALLAGADAATVLLDGEAIGDVTGHFGARPGQTITVGDGFTGELDELRLWSAARTSAAVAADARRPLRGTEPWLLAYWRLDEGAGLELFDAGPAQLDLAATPDPGAADSTAFGPSAAWRLRTGARERALAPIDAGYDADGDPLTLDVTTAPVHGTATADGPALQVDYLPGAGFDGDDQLGFRLTDDEGATGEYAIEVRVARVLACAVAADCSGGDLCDQGTCVAPADLKARAGGCGCTSGGGGALALWALLAFGLTARRRPRPAAGPAGGRP